MRRLFALVRRLQNLSVNVLIVGESGTGKELIARALHESSSQRERPFVAVNCGALDRTLLRSELFGHRRGAFTGATESYAGAFEAANGGTLFLDEIGELPFDSQPMLLRAFELGSIARLGEHVARPVKVRIIAATNRSLENDVAAGRFREDLYHRLNVVKLDVPPLRSRREDVPLLAEHFAMQLGLKALPPNMLEELNEREWPGNVRELRHAIEAYAATDTLPPPQRVRKAPAAPAFDNWIDLNRPYVLQKEEVLQSFARAYFKALLDRTDGNQSEAARQSGLERSHLRKAIIKLGLARPPAFTSFTTRKQRTTR